MLRFPRGGFRDIFSRDSFNPTEPTSNAIPATRNIVSRKDCSRLPSAVCHRFEQPCSYPGFSALHCSAALLYRPAFPLVLLLSTLSFPGPAEFSPISCSFSHTLPASKYTAQNSDSHMPVFRGLYMLFPILICRITIRFPPDGFPHNRFFYS